MEVVDFSYGQDQEMLVFANTAGEIKRIVNLYGRNGSVPSVQTVGYNYQNITGREVEPCNTTLFDIDGVAGTIFSYYEGGRYTKVIVKDLRNPRALAINYEWQKIYWYSDGKGIEESNYDGSCRKPVAKLDYIPYSMAYYKGMLYWTGMNRTALGYINGNTVVKTGKTETRGRRNRFYEIGIMFNKKASVSPCPVNYNRPCTIPDACAVTNGGCEEMCASTEDHEPKCSCKNGKPLKADGKSCDWSNYAVMGANRKIIMYVGNEYFRTVIPISGKAVAVEPDWNVNGIFYSNDRVLKDGRHEYSIMSNYNNKQQLVVKTGQAAIDFTYDQEKETLYYADNTTVKMITNVYGRNGMSPNVSLVKSGFQSITGLEVEPCERNIFIIDGGAGNIYCCKQNGSRTIIVKDLVNPRALAIDYGNHKIYWFSDSYSIEESDYNGNCKRTVAYMVYNPYGMVYFNENLFWVGQNKSALGFTNGVTTVKNGLTTTSSSHMQYYGFAIISNKKASAAPCPVNSSRPCAPKDPCSVNNGGCEDMCVPVNNKAVNNTVKCSCSNGKSLKADNKSCNWNYYGYMGADHRIFMEIGGYHKSEIVISGKALAVDHDWNRNGIFYSNDRLLPDGSHQYAVVSFSKGVHQVIVPSASAVTEFAYDQEEEMLYYANIMGEIHQITNVYGRNRTDKTVASGLQRVTGLEVEPCEKRLFVVDGGQGEIYAFDKKGSKKTIIRGLVNPRTLTLDYGGYKMYWFSDDKGIEESSYNGSCRRTVAKTGYTPYGMIYFNYNLYWTGMNKSAVVGYTNGMTAVKTGVTTTSTSRMPLYGIGVIFNKNASLAPCPVDYSRPCPVINACSVNNGGCEDKCASMNNTAKCSCSNSKALKADGKSCDWTYYGFMGSDYFIVVAKDDMKGKITSEIITISGKATAIAHDWNTNTLFYSNDRVLPNKRHEYSINSYHPKNGYKMIVKTNVAVMDLAYDPDKETLYFASRSEIKKVENVYGRKGRNPFVSRIVSFSKIMGFEVEPCSKIFFVMSEDKIYTYQQGGSNKTIVKDLVNPRGLAIDYGNQKIYWYSDKGGIEESNYDGKCRRMVAKTSYRPNGMYYFYNKLHWNGEEQSAATGFYTNGNTDVKTGVTSTTVSNTQLYGFGIIWNKMASKAPCPINYWRSCPIQDACAINNGGCEEKCVSFNNKAKCSCHAKKLKADGKSCDWSYYSYMGTKTSLYVLLGSHVIAVKPIDGTAYAVDHDWNMNVIFYSNDRYLSNEKRQYSIDCYNPKSGQLVVTKTEAAVIEFTYDQSKETLYYANAMGDVHKITNVYGRNGKKPSKSNVASGFKKVTGLEIEPCNRAMFIVDGDRGEIYRFNESGRNSTILTGLVNPRALTIDYRNHKIYWVSDKGIEESDYDGSCNRTIAQMVHNPYGMIYLDNKLYWTGQDNSVLGYVNGATSVKTGLTTTSTSDIQFYGVGIIFNKNSSLPPCPVKSGRNCSAVDACTVNNGGCEEVCASRNKKAVCSCLNGKTLKADGKSCDWKYYGYSGTDRRIYLATDAASVEIQISGKAVAVDHDWNRNGIFYSNDRLLPDGKHQYHIISYNKRVHQIIIPTKAAAIDFAYDQEEERLYYADTMGEIKMITNVYGRNGKSPNVSSVAPTFKKITGLEMEACEKILFVVDGDQGKIFAVKKDGIKSIVQGLSNPRTITVNYDEQKIYWYSDKGIEVSNYDGSCRRIITQLGYKVNGMVYAWNTLYWMSTSMSPIGYIHGNTNVKTGMTSTFVVDVPVYGFGIIFNKNASLATCPLKKNGTCPVPDACSNNNGGCEEKCTSMKNMAKCSCLDGKALKADMKSCDWSSYVYIASNRKIVMQYLSKKIEIKISGTAYAVDHDWNTNGIFYSMEQWLNGQLQYSIISYNKKRHQFIVKTAAAVIDFTYYQATETLFYATTMGEVKMITNVYGRNGMKPSIYSVVSGLLRITGMEAEPCESTLFVVDGDRGEIYSYKEIGRKTIVRGLHKPRTLSINYADHKIYWFSDNNGFEESNYDGSCRRTVAKMKNKPYGMGYFMGELYWTGMKNSAYGEGQYANGMTNVKTGITYTSKSSQSYGVGIIFNKDGPLAPCPVKYNRPCPPTGACYNTTNNFGCEDTCVSSNDKPNCTCSNGRPLKADGKTCDWSLYRYMGANRRISMNMGYYVKFDIPISGIAHAVDHDWNTNIIFYSNDRLLPNGRHEYTINSYHVKHGHKMIVKTIAAVTVFFYDQDEETLYFANTGAIMMISDVYGRKWKEPLVFPIASDFKQITGMEGDACNKTLFVVDGGKGEIYAYPRNGNKSTIITGLRNPRALTIDYDDHKIYWYSDDKGLQQSNYDGSCNRTLGKFGFAPYSMFYLYGHLYWTSGKDKFSMRYVNGMTNVKSGKTTTSTSLIQYYGNGIIFNKNASLAPCPVNYNRSCDVKDACKDNSGCEDRCEVSKTNQSMSKCSCSDGKQVKDDGKDCDWMDFWYYGANNTIFIMKGNVKNEILISGIVYAVDHDYKKNIIFYSNNRTLPDGRQQFTINKYHPRDGHEIIYTSNSAVMELHFDPAKEMLYFADTHGYLKKIPNVYQSNGSQPSVETVQSSVQISGIEGEPCNREMFIVESRSGGIYKYNGSKKMAIVTGLDNPRGLAINYGEHKIYWYSEKNGFEEANYNGSCRRTVAKIDYKVYRMTYSNGYLVWVGMDISKKGYTNGKTDVKTGKTYTSTSDYRYYGMGRIFNKDPSKAPCPVKNGTCPPEDVCMKNNGGCEDKCTSVNSIANCTCSNDKPLRADGKSCDWSYYGYTATKGKIILQRDNVISEIEVPNRGTVYAVEHDWSKNIIFYSNDYLSPNGSHQYSINSFNPKDGHKVIVKTTAAVIDFTFDSKDKHLYFVDTLGNYQMIFKVYEISRVVVVIGSGLTQITGRSPEACEKYFFVTDNSTGELYTYTMSRKKKVLVQGLVNPRALTVDFVNYKIYWFSDNKGIEECNYDGSCRRSVANTGYKPYDMVYFDGKLYWTGMTKSPVGYTNGVSDVKTGVTTTSSSATQYYGMGIFYNNDISMAPCPANKSQPCRPADACSYNNGGCDEKCTSVNNMAKCSCFHGKSLKADRKSCDWSYFGYMGANHSIILTNGYNLGSVIPTSGIVYAVDHDWNMDVIFYSNDLLFPDGKHKYSINSFNPKKGHHVIAETETAVMEFFYDTTKEILYFANTKGEIKLIANVHGRYGGKPSVYAVTSGLIQITGMEGEPCDRILFVVDGRVGEIYAYRESGGMKTIVKNLVNARTLSIDLGSHRIYWFSENKGIEESNYDGRCRRTVAKIGTTPFGMVYFANNLYWTGMINSTEGYTSGMTTVRTGVTLTKNTPYPYYGIGILFDKNASILPCPVNYNRTCPPTACAFDNGGCEELCTIVDNKAKCNCSNGKPLKADQKSCDWSYYGFKGADGKIVMNRGYDIKFDIDISGRAVAVDFDWRTNTIFYSNERMLKNGSYEYSIKRFNSKRGHEVIAKLNKTAKLLTYDQSDEMNYTLYFADSAGMVFYITNAGNYESKPASPAFYWQGTKVTGMVMEACTKDLFILDLADDKGKIYRVSSSGSNETIIENLDEDARTLSIDYVNHKIYWYADTEIEESDYKGNCRRTVIKGKSNVVEPYDMFYLNGHLYWTGMKKSGALYVSGVRNVKTMKTTSNTSPSRYYGIGIIYNRVNATICPANSSLPCNVTDACSNKYNKNGGCEDTCTTLQNKAMCSCSDGKQLKSDQKSCDWSYYVYFGSNHSIVMTIDFAVRFEIMTTGAVYAVAQDWKMNVLFYSNDRIYPGGKHEYSIQSYNPNGEHKLIVNTTMAAIQLFYDPEIETLYYVNTVGEIKKIQDVHGRKGMKTEILTVIQSSSGIQVNSIEREPCKNKTMFFTDGNKGNIYSYQRSVNQNIINQTIINRAIIHRNLANPRALAINYDDQKIYWFSDNKRIEESNYDGSCRRTVAKIDYKPYDMFYMANNLYWTGMNRSAKGYTNGMTNVRTGKTYTSTSRYQSYGIGVINNNDPSKVPCPANKGRACRAPDRDPCSNDNGGCEDMCVSMKNIVKCSCSNGKPLKADKKSCDWSYYGYFGANQSLFVQIGYSERFTIPISGVANAIEHDWSKNVIFYSNDRMFPNGNHQYSINSYNPRKGHKVIVNTTDAVVDFNHDSVGETLYFANTKGEIKKIENVYGRMGKKKPVVSPVASNLVRITGMEAEPCESKLFVVDGTQGTIYAYNLRSYYYNDTGTIVVGGLRNPRTLAINYDDHKIYWFSDDKGIEESSYDGRCRRTIAKFGNTPYGMVYFMDSLYWTGMNKSDKGGYENGITHVKSGKTTLYTTTVQLYGLGIVFNKNASLAPCPVNYNKPCQGENSCAKNNGGCEGHCTYINNKVRCWCEHGVLRPDQKSCDYTGYMVMGLNMTVVMQKDNKYIIQPIPGMVLAIDYEWSTNTIFYSVQKGMSSELFMFDTKGVHTKLYSASGLMKYLAFDFVGKHMYFIADKSLYKISNVYKMPNKADLVKSFRSPTGLVFVKCQSKVFVPCAVCNSLYAIDNKGVMSTVAKTLKTPTALAVNQKSNKVYIFESSQLTEMNYDGSCRKVVSKSIPSDAKPFSPMIMITQPYDGSMLYWYDHTARGNNYSTYITNVVNGTTKEMNRAPIKINGIKIIHNRNLYKCPATNTCKDPCGDRYCPQNAKCINNICQCMGELTLIEGNCKSSFKFQATMKLQGDFEKALSNPKSKAFKEASYKFETSLLPVLKSSMPNLLYIKVEKFSSGSIIVDFLMIMGSISQTPMDISSVIKAAVDNGNLSHMRPDPTFSIMVKPSPPALFPYGRDIDEVVPKGDGKEYGRLYFPRGIPFLVKMKTEIYINLNGHITADRPEPNPSPNLPTTVPLLGLYMMDFTTKYGGAIFYRRTRDVEILKSAKSQLSLGPAGHRTPKNYNPKEAMVITYYQVSNEFNVSQKFTFQLVYTTDYNIAAFITIYKRLDAPGGKTSISEGACFNDVQRVMMSENLRDKSNINRTGVYVANTVNMMKLCGDNMTKVSKEVEVAYVSSYSLTEGAVYFAFNGNSNDTLKHVFTQVISYNYTGMSFATKVVHMVNQIELKVVPVVNAPFSSKWGVNIVALRSAVQSSEYMKMGRINLPVFWNHPNCHYRQFSNAMDSSPTIMLNAMTKFDPSFMYNGFTTLNLHNVSQFGFGVCYEEMAAFSGPHNISVDYGAMTGDDAASEHGVKSFLKFNREMQNRGMPRNMDNYCERVYFKNLYSDPPLVIVSAEDVQVESAGKFLAWVRDIKKSYTTLCGQTSRDKNHVRGAAMKVHYVVQGKMDACTKFRCPMNLMCQLDRMGKPFCGCRKSCEEARPYKFCASNRVTYTSKCQMYKHQCEMNSKTNITMSYSGPCLQKASQSGKVELDHVAGISSAFCKYVTLNPNIFCKISPISVLLTVTWDALGGLKTHDASASWVEEVSTSKFKACVFIAGRHFNKKVKLPSVYWTAYQNSVGYNYKNIEAGVAEMKTWYTGSRCQYIPLKWWKPSTVVLVSVEHAYPRTYTNAMTAWVEMDDTIIQVGKQVRVCARELQNFDGVHSGIKIHWKAIHQQSDSYVETNQINFPKPNFSNDHVIREVCKTVMFGYMFPKYEDPTVLLTGKSALTADSSRSSFSSRDISVWLEGNNNTYMRMCYKSLRAAINNEAVTIQYTIIPNICPEGWMRNNRDRCVGGNPNRTRSNYDDAVKYCRSKGAALPSVADYPKAYYFNTLFPKSNLWLGIKYDSKNWKFQGEINCSMYNCSYSNWDANEPKLGEGKDCVTKKGGSDKWVSKDCSDKMEFVCELDLRPKMKGCLCMNGGTCHLDVFTSMVSCVCKPGFQGKSCEMKRKY